MAFSLTPLIKFRWFDNNGAPLSSGKIYTYVSGSSTPFKTYADASGISANTNPVVLDASGYAAIYLDDTVAYRFVVKSSSGVVLQTVDNIVSATPSVSASIIQHETVTATQGQTVIPLVNAYTLGGHALTISVNGAVQVSGVDYTETSTNSITMSAGLNLGDVVYVQIFSTSIFTAPVASQVAYAGGTTVQAALDDILDTLNTYLEYTPYHFGAIGNGIADDTDAIKHCDTAAALVGAAVSLNKGTFFVTDNIVFAAPVKVSAGAKILVTDNTKYLQFTAGVDAPLVYWLDTDGPTQFFAIQQIYPQWFGSCGGASEDSSIPLMRAFRACRAGFSSSSENTDKTRGCRTVYFISGTYRCSNVVVYCGTTIDGETGGSPFGARIMQIKYDNPGLRIVPKNYALDGTPINTSVGQNFFTNLGISTELAASTLVGTPQCYFMSPDQATTYLNIPGDVAGPTGHIDTQFRNVWFKSGDCSIFCDEGMLWVHIRDCTFDVVFRPVWHSGTAKGMVRSYNTIYYGAIRGAIVNTSSEATLGVFLECIGDEFKAGACADATVDYRRAINYNPSVYNAGTYVRIKDCTFLKQSSLGFRVGGPIFVKNAETVDITGVMMKSPDSANVQKAIAIQDNVKHCNINGIIYSDDVADYTSATLVQFSQTPQALTDAKLDLSLVNTNATAFPTAVSSNFAISGIDMDRVLVTGNFTSVTGPNISPRDLRVTTVASAATVSLPPSAGKTYFISGTTGITSIGATGWAGKEVRLVFTGALTVTDGGNLKLAGNFVTTGDDVLTLTSDGTNWFEVTRSIN